MKFRCMTMLLFLHCCSSGGGMEQVYGAQVEQGADAPKPLSTLQKWASSGKQASISDWVGRNPGGAVNVLIFVRSKLPNDQLLHDTILNALTSSEKNVVMALQWTIDQGDNGQIFKLLLDKVSDDDRRQDIFNDLLPRAVAKKRVYIASLLLARDADPSVSHPGVDPDKHPELNKKTAVEIAELVGNKMLINLCHMVAAWRGKNADGVKRAADDLASALDEWLTKIDRDAEVMQFIDKLSVVPIPESKHSAMVKSAMFQRLTVILNPKPVEKAPVAVMAWQCNCCGDHRYYDPKSKCDCGGSFVYGPLREASVPPPMPGPLPLLRGNAVAGWTCPACTFKNLSENLTCESCGNQKPAGADEWICHGCSSVHKRASLTCSMCGGPRPEEEVKVAEPLLPPLVRQPSVLVQGLVIKFKKILTSGDSMESKKNQAAEALHTVLDSSTAQKEEKECCVCMDVFNSTEPIAILQCGHHLHKACLPESCPICRGPKNVSLEFNLTSEDEE